ncbi:hypothetical protein [Paenibacillus sp. PL91]|uniref:hypothetical protein n=1 Tax=Paenibacillus sp. PL91 TaxID=2729538 RepID=UPI00145E00F0|nr:hypothetical protein [Paenibacillus sp. PL91]MBC9203655.1 hypothetical protein [Paenibacillus sp. PL91]
MTTNVEKSLIHIHEASMVLHSNMMDAAQVAEKSLVELERQIEHCVFVSTEKTSLQISQMESKVRDEIAKLAKESTVKLSAELERLKQSASEMNESDRKFMFMLKEQHDQAIHIHRNALEQAEKKLTQLVTVARNALHQQMKDLQQSQNHITSQISELSHSIQSVNELIRENDHSIRQDLESKAKRMQVIQLSGFVVLLAAIMAGFFI